MINTSEILMNRLKSLKAVLSIDSPEVRGWSPAVQENSQHVLNDAINYIKDKSAGDACLAGELFTELQEELSDMATQKTMLVGMVAELVTSSQPQVSSCEDTEEAKRARLSNVVGHYAKTIRRMNEQGQWPVDSDLAPILERAESALRSETERAISDNAYHMEMSGDDAGTVAHPTPPDAPTPRTDALLHAKFPCDWNQSYARSMVDFARTIERENAELKRQLAAEQQNFRTYVAYHPDDTAAASSPSAIGEPVAWTEPGYCSFWTVEQHEKYHFGSVPLYASPRVEAGDTPKVYTDPEEYWAASVEHMKSHPIAGWKQDKSIDAAVDASSIGTRSHLSTSDASRSQE